MKYTGQTISTGQTNFYSLEETWFPHLKKTPTVMICGDKTMQDPRGTDYMVRNAKNKKALDSYYSTNMTALGVSANITQLKKVAITSLMENIGIEDITKLMKFTEKDSKYTGIRKDCKSWAERLSIIFTGAYNHGIPCFPEEHNPCLLVENNFGFSLQI